MKKLIILIVCFTLLCGCTKINNDNINNIINSVVSSDNDRANQYRNGYKFVGWCKYGGQGKLANAMLGDSGFVNGMNGITQMARAEESDEFITKQNQTVPSV